MAPSFAADLQVPLLSGEAHAPNRSAWLPTRRLLVVLLALGATCMSCAVLIGGRAGTVVLLLGVTILAAHAVLQSYSISITVHELRERAVNLFTPVGVPLAIPSKGTGTAPAAATESDEQLVLSVNGIEHRLTNPSPSLLLVDFIRSLGLTGTKVACGEGGCGSCTVIATGADGVPRSINACLRLLCACDGLAITTTEGLGSQAEGFAAVQQVIIKLGGSQCGFCTPGWVSAMAALLARKAASGKTLSKAEIESSFDGNLCRCTGYRPILQAFKAAFADDSTEEERQRAGVADLEELGTTPCHDVRTGDACGRECDQACPPERSSRRLAQDGAPETTRRSFRRLALDDARDATLNAACAAPAGVLSARRRERTLSFEDSATGMRYLRPTTLPALQQALLDTPDALLVCANTGMGVAKYYSPQGPTGPAAQPPQRDATLIDVSQVDVLKTAPVVSTVTPLGPTLTCGAAVTLETLLGAMENAAGGGSATAAGIARQLKRIATTQVRGVGSWAGNLALAAANPAFASDLAVALCGAGATVLTVSRTDGGPPRVSTVLDYLRCGGHGVVLVTLAVPLATATVFYVDKVSLRHANAHSIVNAAVRFELELTQPPPSYAAAVNPGFGHNLGHNRAVAAAAPPQLIVRSCSAAFGGLVSGGLFVPSAAPSALVGRSLTDPTTLEAWVAGLQSEALAIGLSNDPRHASAYRLQLLRAYAYKAVLHALYTHGLLVPRLASAVADSLAAISDRVVSSGVQQIDVSDPSLKPVSESMPTLDAILQASGEALYTSDLCSGSGGYAGAVGAGRALFGAFVSTPAGSVGQVLHSIQT